MGVRDGMDVGERSGKARRECQRRRPVCTKLPKLDFEV